MCSYTAWLPFLSYLLLHCFFTPGYHILQHSSTDSLWFLQLPCVLLKYIQNGITNLFYSPILTSSDLASLLALSNYYLAICQPEAILDYFMFAFLLPGGCLSAPAQVLYFICVLSGIWTFHFHVSYLMSF